jgi:SAM-dependent methyltransferase
VSAIHLADALKHSLALAFAQGSARPYKATVLRRLATAWLGDRRQFSRKWLAHTCPICGYFGMFISAGKPPRWDARCPQCGSRERHRLTQLWLGEDGGNKLDGKRILHFAPEKVVVRQMRHNPLYETADLHQVGVTHRVDISQVPLPDASYDVVIAHHVLEHVDNDRQAMSEVFRLLKPGALAVLSVPINAARQQTYENSFTPALTVRGRPTTLIRRPSVVMSEACAMPPLRRHRSIDEAGRTPSEASARTPRAALI